MPASAEVTDTTIETVARGPRTRAAAGRFRPKVWLACADLTVVAIAILAAWFVRRHAGSGLRAHDAREALVLLVVSLPIWIGAFVRYRLYSSRCVTRSLEEIRRLLSAVTAGTVGIAVLAYATKTYAPRALLLLVWGFAFVALTVERRAARAVFAHLRRQGRMMRRVVIIGCNREGREIAHMFASDPSLGYEVAGFVDDADEPGTDDTASPPLLGSVELTKDLVLRSGATGVVIAATAMKLGTSNRLIRDLTRAGIHVELSSTMRDIAADRLTIRPLGRFPVVYVEPVHEHGWRSVAKRGFDLLVAVVLLVVGLPVIMLCAVLVVLDSSGPALFRQVRVGRDGRPFHLYKIRTMVTNAESLLIDLRDHNERDGPLFKMSHDPRTTRVGRFLRRTSLDELPQLWNVVRGEMSLVGPRPALPGEIADWSTELHERLRVRPGITGMWQVHGRGEMSFREYERLDLYYVDNWSLLNDLAILAKTVPTVLLRRGAW